MLTLELNGVRKHGIKIEITKREGLCPVVNTVVIYCITVYLPITSLLKPLYSTNELIGNDII